MSLLEQWLTPDRRAALRAGAEPTTDIERIYQDRFIEHQAEKARTDARRS